MPRASSRLPPPDVARVVSEAALAPARGRGRRSPLYLWFRDNHDELTAAFGRSSPSWTKLAEVLGSHGLVDGDGKPPTARGARGAWARVRTDIKATSDSAPIPKAAPVRVVSPLPAIQPEPEVTEPEFQIARPPRAVTLAPAPSPASASRQQQDPDEVIANLFARPKARSIPMPAVPEPEEEN